MTRGAPELTITVIPDTGTDQLAGLRGKMNIIIADGKHSYEFEYALGEGSSGGVKRTDTKVRPPV